MGSNQISEMLQGEQAQSTGSCWLTAVLVSNINSPHFSNLCALPMNERCACRCSLLLPLFSSLERSMLALFLSACPSENSFFCFIWIPHCFPLSSRHGLQRLIGNSLMLQHKDSMSETLGYWGQTLGLGTLLVSFRTMWDIKYAWWRGG